jgi:alkanesulfonate monooxygenase SsuD/methylene tetrahydromethanopterin reductase-like flavin-dependent oxidoreductase (luciferase family)
LDFITDDIVESFCVLGDDETHIEKIKRMADAGVTQYNIYLDNGDEEEIIAHYGNNVIPNFK